MRDTPFLNLVLMVALLLMGGWLLVIGKSLLLPIFTAIISVYVLISCSTTMARWPVLRHFPGWFLRLIALTIFTLTVIAMGLVVDVTIREMVELAPGYQANLEKFILSVSQYLGWETDPTWDDVLAATVERINVQSLMTRILGSATSLTATIFLVIVYAGFLMAERGGFARKLAAALPDQEQAKLTGEMIHTINSRIGDYLAVKTGINIILGAISFVILQVMDVDFAIFWALMIALLNYIPYVGSLIAVAFPVVLSLAQFGSLVTTLLLGGLLTGAQMYVGNILEPKLIGRQLNLSPFVVLVALSFWSTLWGIPGAILAIPMTSMFTILCSAFPATRFIAILLSDSIEEPLDAWKNL